MTPQRPLFKHIRDHDALFAELARYRDLGAENLGLKGYEYHKTPKFIGPNGERLTIEPERSIIIPTVNILKGVKSILTQSVQTLTPIEHSDIGYRYPTAALAGLDAPFIKRLRSEYFHRTDEERDICRPINLSFGIKSRGKADNRLEYEVWLPDDDPNQNPLPLFIDKYGEDLPHDIRQFVVQEQLVYGWMGVKRAAYEALYQNKDAIGDIVVCVGLSIDAYNIGANPDLSYSDEMASSIAVSNAELEWEIMGYYAPAGENYGHDQVWEAINYTLNAIGDPLNDIYHSVIIPIAESKTERILSTIRDQGITVEHIKHLQLKPCEFLQTASPDRMKSHDPSRTVNLLGRLNRLFYQPEHKLPSIKYMHDLIV
jgi:hypothetical protein